MLFNSLEFSVFFPIVCLLYYIIPSNKWRNHFLLAASYYFYMCWEPTYALLLLSSTVVTYLAGLLISKCRSRTKTFLTLSLVINLGILFFYKYYGFAAENVTALMDSLGIAIHVPEFRVLLPVGISFYIFQALGYSIDVARGDVQAERNFFTYALFVSFFPQLVAGPIERSTHLLQQFYNKHIFNSRQAIEGIQLMLWGFFLKLVIADRCAMYVDKVYGDLGSYNGGSALTAAILFMFTLYGDFAGYSYIAIGSAKVMGFNLRDNFRRPLFYSVSVQDFWRRWHISLSSWLRDYVYIPLGGSRHGNRYVNLMITMLISGFWHGAAWTYVTCFFIFGIFLVICTMKRDKQALLEQKFNLTDKEWWLWLNRLITFALVVFAFIFFRADSLSDGMLCIRKIFTDLGIPEFRMGEGRRFALIAGVSLVMLFICEYVMEYRKVIIDRKRHVAMHSIMSCGLFLLILIFGVFDGSLFIYFQF